MEKEMLERAMKINSEMIDVSSRVKEMKDALQTIENGMKPLSLTIKPPITEHCSKCEYENAYSFAMHRVKCPECGNNGLGYGARPLKKQAVRVTRSSGNYNLIDLRHEQFQYRFHNVPKGLTDNSKFGYLSFVVDDELDIDDPLEVAQELSEIIGGYLCNSDKGSINKLAEFLEENEEEQAELRYKETRAKLEAELYELIYWNDGDDLKD